ncbi:MAG TPA: ABC transporter ATP-binding protein [Desulfotomaculum sp.]|nr:ABC transporter ATP-binding protein [Desulfotomaculum sp.]
MLKLVGVNKRLGEFHLRDIDLAVLPGEYFVILGPTGSGKTVLLETIAGMHPPDAGRIFFAGKEITRLPPEERRIGFVYQDYALFPHLDVRQNILFGLQSRKIPAAAREGKLGEVVQLLGIGHLLARNPSTLSGGEQQRVALARALVTEPQIFLLDEPLSALDPRTREGFQRELQRIHRATGTLTVHVTHDFAEAAFLADRIAVMQRGRLVQVGSPEEIFSRPSSLFTARFVGLRNVFAGEVLGAKGHRLFRAGRLELAVETGFTGPAGCVLHPEHLRLSPTPTGGTACLPGRVTAVYRRRFYLEVTVDAGEELVLWFPPAGHNHGSHRPPRVGEKVWCVIPPAAVHLFPRSGD